MPALVGPRSETADGFVSGTEQGEARFLHRVPWRVGLAREFNRMQALEEWSVQAVLARHGKFAPPGGAEPGVSNGYTFGCHFAGLREAIAQLAQRLPDHGAYIAATCAAEPGGIL